ncbi:MAG: coproporphyrinogen dehydrogenase HemZ [Muricomes sp.]
MIDISSKDTFYMYNLYHIVKAFFPNEEIRQKVDEQQEPLIRLELEGGSCFSVCMEEAAQFPDRREAKHYVTKCIYDYLKEKTGKGLAWGMLTGIRPTKMVMQKLEAGAGREEVIKFLEEVYSVSTEKAVLGYEIACRERELLQKLDADKGYSLYIGIPFCPSICSYCSFGSSPLDKWADRIDLYLDALCKELAAIGEAVKGQKLNTIYIGGGTPSTLEAEQLERLLGFLEVTFSYDDLKEFTVEAGRPDSITREKLEVLTKHPVTRISVNPQTMQQKTLDAVGRRHLVEDVKEIFHLAREMGFDNINMDLIAGLPGEDRADMQDTLRQIEELGPDSLTVHALAIKRAARYGQEGRKIDLHSEIEQMLEDSAKAAERMGLKPYYLYRQKNMAGNFENVGYAKVDKAGIYNILIMEEKQTILAVGAGASTKIVFPEKIRLENGRESNLVRIENVKDIEEYISRIDEMIERKGEWLWR